MSETPELSVVAPVFNERAALPEFHKRLTAALAALGLPHEILYVDDGSDDGTRELLRGWRQAQPAVRVLSLSRNFGHQAAITAGLDHARGRACVVIDADGQDPPELLSQFVERWKQGAQVVYGARVARDGEAALKRLTAAVYYRLLQRLSGVGIPVDAGDFRLLDRAVVDALRGMRESHRYLRGLTCWVGFKQSRVEYARGPRLGGSTHYPLAKMLALATEGVTSFSLAPLRWVAYSGLASFILSIGLGCWALYVRLFTGGAVRGWTSLMIVILFMGGLQLVSLGVIGAYLGRVFDEVKRRPLYIVSEGD